MQHFSSISDLNTYFSKQVRNVSHAMHLGKHWKHIFQHSPNTKLWLSPLTACPQLFIQKNFIKHKVPSSQHFSKETHFFSPNHWPYPLNRRHSDIPGTNFESPGSGRPKRKSCQLQVDPQAQKRLVTKVTLRMNSHYVLMKKKDLSKADKSSQTRARNSSR